MLVHKKPNRLQSHIPPLFNAGNPVVYAQIVSIMKTIAYKSNKSMRGRKFHVYTIATTGSIGNYGAYIPFAKQIENGISVLSICKPLLMAHFHKYRDIFG